MQTIKEMSIDLETYSDQDIKKSGVYRYSESPDFEILLFAISINSGPVVVYDIANGEMVAEDIIQALVSDHVIKWAFNAAFERICISSWLRTNYPSLFKGYGLDTDTTHHYLDPVSWRCSMIWSAYLGLPLSLEAVGKVLKLEQQKIKEGKDLIRYFCMPCKQTKSNDYRTRNYPFHSLEKWNAFIQYNKRDVEIEIALQSKLSEFPVPNFIWHEYYLDQVINDRGIALDMKLVNNAILFDEKSKSEIISKLKAITHLDNPNSVIQMKQWLISMGIETQSLGKKDISELLKTVPIEIADVLTLKLQASKSSIRKYQAMKNAVCADGRARGMFQFYGGNRTGRWAGRIIQLQNLPQNHISDLSEARQLVRDGDYDMLDSLYDDIPDTLSQLIRTAFIPKPGSLFYVADFSAIEARVLSFLAGETWRIDTFKNNKDIYCESASQMFHVPVEKHGVNGHLRQKGKIAELALGYGGSTGALKAMGALDMGLSEEELQPLVDAWRSSNPHIVQLWWDVDNAVKTVIRHRINISCKGVEFMYKSGMLIINLPSGRCLYYVKPKIGENKFGGESVTYEGVGGTKKWERIQSYGPKIVENIVQAVSRDLLSYALQQVSPLQVVGHVHDELIIEGNSKTSLSKICAQMSRPPHWLSGIPLNAEGYVTPWYKKE